MKASIEKGSILETSGVRLEAENEEERALLQQLYEIKDILIVDDITGLPGYSKIIIYPRLKSVIGTDLSGNPLVRSNT